jgi:hypothetical protein
MRRTTIAIRAEGDIRHEMDGGLTMLWLILPIFVQIVCAVHVIRTGRNQAWLFLILFFSVIGCAVYFIIEVMPGMRANRHVRTARSVAIKTLDPERVLRVARDDLLLADTMANRIAFADALAELDRHGEAVNAYREALAMSTIEDPRTKARLARSLFESGRPADALAIVEGLPGASGTSEGDRRLLLKARILAELGRRGEAVRLYEELIARIPGEEARCRYAALLLESGDRSRARAVLEEVEQRARRLDRSQRLAERDMYDWAARELKTLKG